MHSNPTFHVQNLKFLKFGLVFNFHCCLHVFVNMPAHPAHGERYFFEPEVSLGRSKICCVIISQKCDSDSFSHSKRIFLAFQYTLILLGFIDTQIGLKHD